MSPAAQSDHQPLREGALGEAEEDGRKESGIMP